MTVVNWLGYVFIRFHEAELYVLGIMILAFIRLCSETLDSGLNPLKPKVVTNISVLAKYKIVALNFKHSH